ncbi:MAG: hypothetical protein KOO69_03115 [Victivallales bacterium]|nr:hypothetical protein [Victivallales bacterium]
MNFEFDMTLEFDAMSFMYLAYPQIFDDDGVAVLEIVVEVENYISARPAPYIKNTMDNRFYDDGDNLEADIKLVAIIDDNRVELPTKLVAEFDILSDVDAIGLQKIEENKLDFQLNNYYLED